MDKVDDFGFEVRWFGDQWPSRDNPAPVCEKNENRIDVPVGTKCLQCTGLVTDTDRGVVTACSPSIWGHWYLQVGDVEVSVCSYHLRCFLEEVVGGTWSATFLNRMEHQATRSIPEGEEEPVIEYGDEEVEPGRGWNK